MMNTESNLESLDVNNQINDDDPPPSYDSLFGKIKQAKTDSNGVLDFFRKLCYILLGTICFSIFLAILLAIPIAMIVIGSIYLHDCPFERYIPIYLIVGGVFAVIKNLSSLIQNLLKKKEESESYNKKSNPFDAILSVFLFAWFIAGSYWVYHIYSTYQTDPMLGRYCHATVYQFAFWLITASYIILALVFCCSFCGGLICLKFG